LKQSKPSILIIGAVPPPAIGPSLANERLLGFQALHEKFTVSFLDISDHRSPLNLGKLDAVNFFLGLKHAWQCWHRLIFQSPELVYVLIAQTTLGYLRDMMFIVPATLLGKRIIIHLRGSEFRVFYEKEMPFWLRWLSKWMLSRAARVIVLGQRLAGIFDGLVAPSRVVVIPNGIAFRMFEREGSFSDARPGRRLLFLSSLRKRKGLFVLLEALPQVFSRFPDATITIAGLWQDHADKTTADALIARLGLREKVRFVGEIVGEAKVRLLHEHDVFVFAPIEPEGLPWVILEAMSASLPVVTSDQGAIAEVVEQNQTGLIVEPVPERIAAALCDLLANPAMARSMGERGRKRVEEHFSEEVCLAKMVALFETVANEQRDSNRTSATVTPGTAALPVPSVERTL
jgi:glycosyltransferase involved in cell wall biosynthesis